MERVRESGFPLNILFDCNYSSFFFCGFFYRLFEFFNAFFEEWLRFLFASLFFRNGQNPIQKKREKIRLMCNLRLMNAGVMFKSVSFALKNGYTAD